MLWHNLWLFTFRTTTQWAWSSRTWHPKFNHIRFVEQGRDVDLLASLLLNEGVHNYSHRKTDLLSASSFYLARVAIPAARHGLMNEIDMANALRVLPVHNFRQRSSTHKPCVGFASLLAFCDMVYRVIAMRHLWG